MSSSIISLFPIRTLRSAADALHEDEILVILRNMAGTEYIAAIANTQLTSTLQLFAEHHMGVYHEQIHLSVDNMPLTGNELVCCLETQLSKTGNVIQVVIKEPAPVIPYFMRPDILHLPRAHRYTPMEGW